MDPLFKKLAKIIVIKLVVISIIFFAFFNQPKLSVDPQLEQQKIESHFLNNPEKKND